MINLFLCIILIYLLSTTFSDLSLGVGVC